MSANKQPKPFLKRGTRKFLSNATVRSLNQKPNIVQFDDQNETDFQQTKSIQAVTFAKKQQEEIIVQVKRNPNNKSNSTHNVIAQSKKPKENKPMNQEQLGNNNNTNNKKKPTLLEDYIGGQSSSNKKDLSRSSFSKQKIKPVINNGTHFNSMVGSLQRQQLQTHSDDEAMQLQATSTKTVHQNGSNNKIVFPPKDNGTKKNVVINEQQQDEQKQKIVFKQESDEEQVKVNIKRPSNQKFNQISMPTNNPKVKYESKNKWDQQQEQQHQTRHQEESSKGPSKVLQKYYKKEPLKTEEKIQKVSTVSKLSIKDITNELKQQIISEYLSEKKSEIDKKLEELKDQYVKIKKQKEKYEQENKRLVKQRQQFNKQMQQKTKQFEQKLKTENNKLNRQKKYMKDVQLSGKADWRLKNEVQELKAKVQQSQSEKKKMKGDYLRQADRLKKKIQQMCEQNESLKQQIKYIQMQKIQIKQKSKKIQKTIDTFKKINYWQGAPTDSYLFSFGENDFNLFKFESNFFNYENLQHYKYYLRKRGEAIELQSEEQGANNNIVRRYKNGKEEIEYVSKVLKQNFPAPFKFSVVTHLNGDIKLIYPNGIIVYFDSRNQITEFKISTQKSIYHFHKLGQLEMKFRHLQQGEIHQLRKGNILIRKSRKGEQKFKKLQNGVIQNID